MMDKPQRNSIGKEIKIELTFRRRQSPIDLIYTKPISKRNDYHTRRGDLSNKEEQFY